MLLPSNGKLPDSTGSIPIHVKQDFLTSSHTPRFWQVSASRLEVQSWQYGNYQREHHAQVTSYNIKLRTVEDAGALVVDVQDHRRVVRLILKERFVRPDHLRVLAQAHPHPCPQAQ